MSISSAKLGILVSVLVSVASVIGYPTVSLMTNLVGVEGSFIRLLFRLVVAFASVLIVLVLALKSHALHLKIGLAAFLLIYSFRLILDFGGGVPNIEFALSRFILTVLVPTLAIAIAAKHADNEYIFRNAVAVCGLIVVASFHLLGPSYTLSNLRAGFENLNPIALGHAAVSTILCFAIFLVESRYWTVRIFSLLVILFAFPIILSSGSRGPLIALVIAGCWLFFHSRRTILAGSLVIVATLLSWDDSSILARRIDQFFQGEEQSAIGRSALLREGFAGFLDSPLIGSMFSLPSGQYPHNLFVEAAMATGIIGLFALFWFVLLYFKALRHVGRKYPLMAALSIQGFVFVQFSGAIYINTIFFPVATLLIMLSVHARTEERQSPSHDTDQPQPLDVPGRI